MSEIIADLYSPLLAMFCIYYLRFVMNKKYLLGLVLGYVYVYGFAFIEFQFGWWMSIGADFSSHTAAVMVMVTLLLAVNLKVGFYAFISLLIYAFLMVQLNYHSWFDIISTIIVCLPCWLLFTLVGSKEAQ